MLEMLLLYQIPTLVALRVCFRKASTSADLTLSNLCALRASSQDAETKHEGRYAANGKDPKRVNAVLKTQAASGCKCNRESGT